VAIAGNHKNPFQHEGNKLPREKEKHTLLCNVYIAREA